MHKLRIEGCIGSPEVLITEAPFSNFDFIENRFGFLLKPIQRIFSLARVSKFKTMVIEEIKSVGFSKEDDDDLKEFGCQLSKNNLVRISFFKTKFEDVKEIGNQSDNDYLGYLILKEIPFKKNKYRWIVFESIMKSSRHDNNYYHSEKEYQLSCGSNIFKIRGNIYCQQNDITNVCAHVALRTCISMTSNYDDFSCRAMNLILKRKKCPHQPGNGLSDGQIKAILNELGIKYTLQSYPSNSADSVDGEKENDSKEEEEFSVIPYQKFIYASIESGQPALLGFSGGGDVGHIIPILGHTFNEDTWVPHAETSYMVKIGEHIRYVPSESWVSTFICHDDNFGSHFCLPRRYLSSDNNILVIAFQPNSAKFDGISAETIAIDYLYKIAYNFPANPEARWLKRLKDAIYIEKGWVVLRAIYLSGDQYIEHLKELKGWEGEVIVPELVEKLKKTMTGTYWMVEISLPELFPSNRRKLGEVIIDAEKPLSSDFPASSCLYARLPGGLYVLGEDENKKMYVLKVDPGIKTHTELYANIAPK